MEEADAGSVDLDRLMETDSGEDKIFAAMGVAKTITTVCRDKNVQSRIVLTVHRLSRLWIPLPRSLLKCRRSSSLSSYSLLRANFLVRISRYTVFVCTNGFFLQRSL